MGVLNVPKPAWRDEEDLNIFEDAVGRFLQEHAPPEAGERWREQGIVDRELWNRAGEAGLLCLSTPEEYGGMGGDYRHEAILMEQLGRHSVDSWGVSLHNAIVAPYITHYGTEEQKRRWLPKLASGEYIGAIAMTEPGAGFRPARA
jgi:acyl-CoA dehydrogenase